MWMSAGCPAPELTLGAAVSFLIGIAVPVLINWHEHVIGGPS